MIEPKLKKGLDIARKFLDYLLAGKIPKPGRIVLTPMLTPKGKLYGDLTIACLGEERFMLFGSGAAQEMHRRWFEKFLPKDLNKIIVKNVLFELARVTKLIYPFSDIDYPDLSLDKPKKSKFKN